MDSIRKRLTSRYLAVILLTIIVLEGLFIFTTINYYYGGVGEALLTKATISSNFVNRYAPSFSLDNKARYIFENIDKNEMALVEVVNGAGLVILDNSGFYPDKSIDSPDFGKALRGEVGKWQGRNKLGERVMAVATPLWRDGEVVGVLRYTSSLAAVDKTVKNILFFAFLIGLAVFLLALLISTLLSRTIVKPITDLTLVAEQMALGNLAIKTPDLKYDDEIKKLANTLDYMAAEIIKTDKIKNDFISSISHELRTPLTSIKGWTETILAADRMDTEENRQGLKIVIRETDRLTYLVEELLDFSKYQSTEIVLKRENIEMKEIINKAVEQLRIKAKEKEIRLNFKNQATNTRIYADYHRIMQVILNLLDNAIKFTPDRGTISIIINDNGDSLETIITDTGIGISKEDLDKIKLKFFKADLKTDGSGLGLAIVEEIVNLHGGDLIISSQINQGSRVIIKLPVYDDKG